MPLVWKRVQDIPKNWTVIYKALCLLEHLVRHGSQKVIDDARENLSKIRYLQEFQYQDEQSRERGSGIRAKAKEIADLLMDDEQLRKIRTEAQKNRDKYVGMSSEGHVDSSFGGPHYLQEYDRGVGTYTDENRPERRRSQDTGDSHTKPKKKTPKKSSPAKTKKPSKKKKGQKKKKMRLKKKKRKKKRKKKKKKRKKRKKKNQILPKRKSHLLRKSLQRKLFLRKLPSNK